jgi:hypothetical protein
LGNTPLTGGDTRSGTALSSMKRLAKAHHLYRLPTP